MRVLAMLNLYTPATNAGGQMTAHALLRHLATHGHEVHVTLSRAQPGPAYELDGVHVHPYTGPRTGPGDPFRWIPNGCDVVVTHLGMVQRAALLTDLNGLPFVNLLHNQLERTMERLTRYPPQLAVFNAHWVEAAARRAGYTGPGIVVHPPTAVADYATTPGDMVTLVNLSEPKGGRLFWQLARRMPDVKFLAVRGGYGDQIIADLPNVEILGHVVGAEMAERVYSRTRVLLMPSLYEAWGRVGVEAMCSGIPVVAHPTPGLRESLGEAGTFADRDDLDAWEAAVRRLLDGRRWPAASRRSSARAGELDPAESLERWRAALETAVANYRPSRRRR